MDAKTPKRKKVIVLGGGPNRIGQGIEFDYCCVHASYALREMGYEAIMVNSNPLDRTINAVTLVTNMLHGGLNET